MSDRIIIKVSDISMNRPDCDNEIRIGITQAEGHQLPLFAFKVSRQALADLLKTREARWDNHPAPIEGVEIA